eukprot:s751_g9.t1
MEVTACPKLSKLQVLESDWYVFQDAGATEAVAAGIQDLCKDRLEDEVVLVVVAVVAVVMSTVLVSHPLCGFVFAGERPTSDIQRLRVLGLAAVSYGAGSVDKAALLAAVREGVAERGGGEIWQAGARALAQNLDASQEDAELILAKAFGWTGWYELNRPSYLKPKLPPAPEEIFEALSWLRQGPLQLTAEQLRNALAIKPLVYLKEPRSSYELALQVAPEQWRAPDAFKETHNCLLTDPAERVKDEWGEAVHCDGKCTHCWRTATPKLMGKDRLFLATLALSLNSPMKSLQNSDGPLNEVGVCNITSAFHRRRILLLPLPPAVCLCLMPGSKYDHHEALMRRAFEDPNLKFDLQMMHNFLKSVLEHHAKAWDVQVAAAGRHAADLVSLAALRQRGEARG